MSEPKTVKELAAALNAALVWQTRATGDHFVTLADGSPDWMTTVCHAAHGDMLPDDWRYSFVEDAAAALANDDDGVDLDSCYPYKTDRLDWLASNLERPGHCNAAAKEYGVKYDDILAFIAVGMQREMEEVYNLVEDALEDLEAAAEEDDLRRREAEGEAEAAAE